MLQRPLQCLTNVMKALGGSHINFWGIPKQSKKIWIYSSPLQKFFLGACGFFALTEAVAGRLSAKKLFRKIYEILKKNYVRVYFLIKV